MSGFFANGKGAANPLNQVANREGIDRSLFKVCRHQKTSLINRIVKSTRAQAHTGEHHNKHHIHMGTSNINIRLNHSTCLISQRHCRIHLSEPISRKTGHGQVGKDHPYPPPRHLARSIRTGLDLERIGRKDTMRRGKVEWQVHHLPPRKRTRDTIPCHTCR